MLRAQDNNINTPTHAVMIFCYKKLAVCIPYFKEEALAENEDQAVAMVKKWIYVSYQLILWATNKNVPS